MCINLHQNSAIRTSAGSIGFIPCQIGLLAVFRFRHLIRLPALAPPEPVNRFHLPSATVPVRISSCLFRFPAFARHSACGHLVPTGFQFSAVVHAASCRSRMCISQAQILHLLALRPASLRVGGPRLSGPARARKRKPQQFQKGGTQNGEAHIGNGNCRSHYRFGCDQRPAQNYRAVDISGLVVRHQQAQNSRTTYQRRRWKCIRAALR